MTIAVLGLGSAGSRHAANMVDLGEEVVGFDPGRVAPASGIRLMPSLGDALEIAEGVVVASPNTFHADQTAEAIQRGLHVLVEKPLATRANEGERLLELATGATGIFAVAMNLRFHPGVLALRGLIESGRLGSVRLAQASFGFDLRRWRPKTDYRMSYSARQDLGGGIVLDAIHELDYLLWLLGPVDQVTAECAHLSDLDIDVEDLAVATLRLHSGAFACVDLNYFEPVYRRGCRIVGSEAVAWWDWTSERVTVGSADGTRQIDVRCDVAATYREVARDFLEAISTGTPARTSFQEGLAALRVAESIKQAAREGARVTLAPG
jgi:predicted dehydrogenase